MERLLRDYKLQNELVEEKMILGLILSQLNVNQIIKNFLVQQLYKHK